MVEDIVAPVHNVETNIITYPRVLQWFWKYMWLKRKYIIYFQFSCNDIWLGFDSKYFIVIILINWLNFWCGHTFFTLFFLTPNFNTTFYLSNISWSCCVSWLTTESLKIKWFFSFFAGMWLDTCWSMVYLTPTPCSPVMSTLNHQNSIKQRRPPPMLLSRKIIPPQSQGATVILPSHTLLVSTKCKYQLWIQQTHF